MKVKRVLVVLGIVFVIIGHLGDGTATRETAFWLGIAMSIIGLVQGARREEVPDRPVGVWEEPPMTTRWPCVVELGWV